MADEEAYGTYPYRWLVLACFMFVAAVTQLMWLNYAAITSDLQKLMGYGSEFPVVLLATMFPLLYIPVSIPAGIIIDRKGYRYAVLIGAVLTTGFSFLRLFAGTYPLVLIGMIGISIGQPFVLNSITKMVSTWFPTEESALADGLATLSLFLGMIIALALTPPLFNAFGKDLNAVRNLVLVYSLISAAALIFFAIAAKARPPKPPKRTEEDIAGKEAAINLRNFRKLFELHNFKLLCVVLLVGNGSFVGLLQLIDKIMKPKGISSGTAGNIGAVMVLAGIIGCIVLPAISDRIMRRKPFVLIAAGMAVPTISILAAVSNTALIFMTGGVLGLFMFSAFPIVLAYSEETTGSSLTGTATGVLLLLGNAGGVVITLIMESLKGAFGADPESFFWSLIFVVILFAVGFIFATRLQENTPAIRGEEP